MSAALFDFFDDDDAGEPPVEVTPGVAIASCDITEADILADVVDVDQAIVILTRSPVMMIPKMIDDDVVELDNYAEVTE